VFQLLPLPPSPIILCFIKIQNSSTFQTPAYLGYPAKEADQTRVLLHLGPNSVKMLAAAAAAAAEQQHWLAAAACSSCESS